MCIKGFQISIHKGISEPIMPVHQSQCASKDWPANYDAAIPPWALLKYIV